MANQTTSKFTRKNIEHLPENFPVSRSKKSLNFDNFNPDELIRSLSQSYENRRAMQAFEWEAIRLGAAFRRETMI
jgi:hypothetical protein